MSKFSLWLTYSTCKNAKRKPQQKGSMCVNYTTPPPKQGEYNNLHTYTE